MDPAQILGIAAFWVTRLTGSRSFGTVGAAKAMCWNAGVVSPSDSARELYTHTNQTRASAPGPARTECKSTLGKDDRSAYILL